MAKEEISIPQYLTNLNDQNEAVAECYLYASFEIINIIEDYKRNRTNLQKPKNGWIQPTMRKCDDECFACPHRVEWSITFFNSKIGKFSSRQFHVDAATIDIAGSKEAKEQKKEILAIKKRLDELLKYRTRVRRYMMGSMTSASALLKRRLILNINDE